MKHKAPQEPKPCKAFRDKYLAALMMAAALLISFVTSAQTDSAKYSPINGYGFKYKRVAWDSVMMVPLSSSPHVPYRKGGIRYNPGDSTLQLWTGNQWLSIVTGVGNGVDTAYMVNDTVLTIETPAQNFLLQVSKRHVDSIYRKPGQDSIFYKIYGIERAIKDSSGGGSTTLNNVGIGYRLATTPNGSVKSLVFGYGINGDSTTNANAITVVADTSELVTPSDLNDAVSNADRLSVKTFYLSKNGGVSDADITMHSSSDGTDNTAAIKNILDQASSTQAIELVIDGRFSADSLRIKSNTTITILKGGGLIQRTGANCSFIANYNRTAGAVIDSNIIIRGGTINGHGHNSDATENRPYNGAKGWNTILNFRGIKNLTISDCEIINSRTFLSFISNCENVIIQNCNGLQSPSIPDVTSPPDVSYSLIHDGFKFNGPCNNVSLLNNSAYSVDDAVSICANDGFFPTATSCFGLALLDSFVSYGTIKNFKVDGFTFKNGYHGFRILTSADTIENVSFTNISGTVNENLCIIDNFPGVCVYNHGASYIDGYIKNLTFNNVNVNVIPNTFDNSTGDAGIYVSTFIEHFNLSNFSYSGYQSGYPLFKLNAAKSITNLYSNGIVVKETQPPATAFTLTGTATNKRGDVFDNHESDVTVFNGYNVVLKKTGTDRDLMLTNDATSNNVANLTTYPNAGTNVASDLSVVPRGSGFGSFKSQLSFFNTDYKADKTNVELIAIRATGSDGYGFASLAGGTGVRRNMWFDLTGSLSKDSASLTLDVNKQIGINNPAPTHKLDIINTGNGSTGWGLRITGSSSSGPGIVLKNNDNSKNWLLTNGLTTATDGTFTIYDLENSAARLSISGSTGTVAITGDATVADEAYDATAWNGNFEVPTKNAIRDKIESMSVGGITSINSHTGPAITVQGGTALSVDNSVSNTVTFNVTPSSWSLPHTLDAVYTTAGNTSTTETDLYSYTLPAGQLGIDGRTINFEIDGEFNDNTITAQLRLYFGGNVTLNTGAVSVSTAFTKWKLTGYVMRTSSSTAHVTYELQCPGLATTVFLGYSNLTSLDFTTTNVFKISAQAAGGGASNSDITAHSWQLLYKPQPQ